MLSLESRIERLEAEREEAALRPMNDAELAVRMYWLVSKGGPDADRLLDFLASADARTNDHAYS
jgi:hypothetical protein